MAKILTDKVAIITGGARGIGFAIADKFLLNDSKVVILLDKNEKEGIEAVTRLNNTYGNARAVFMKCDVTEDFQNIYDEIVDKYERVDILVNNAAIFNASQAKEIMDINVLALINWSMKFNEHMRKDKNGKGGTIINISSIYGFRDIPYSPIYQASKFAVCGFTKSLGHLTNYDKSGVRVVGICPGFTDTFDLANVKISDEDRNEEFKKFIKEEVWQGVDVVGEAAVEVFEKAPSGTLWVIEGGKPIYEV